jgi:hypothetical protein
MIGVAAVGALVVQRHAERVNLVIVRPAREGRDLVAEAREPPRPARQEDPARPDDPRDGVRARDLIGVDLNGLDRQARIPQVLDERLARGRVLDQDDVGFPLRRERGGGPCRVAKSARSRRTCSTR